MSLPLPIYAFIRMAKISTLAMYMSAPAIFTQGAIPSEQMLGGTWRQICCGIKLEQKRAEITFHLPKKESSQAC